MKVDHRDPHRPFDEIVRDIKREHRSRNPARTARHSRPRTMAQDERRLRWRWGLAIVIGLGLAIAVAFALPT